MRRPIFQLRSKAFIAHMIREIGRGRPREDSGRAQSTRNVLPQAIHDGRDGGLCKLVLVVGVGPTLCRF
jgi:hypothetical protein